MDKKGFLKLLADESRGYHDFANMVRMEEVCVDVDETTRKNLVSVYTCLGNDLAGAYNALHKRPDFQVEDSAVPVSVNDEIGRLKGIIDNLSTTDNPSTRYVANSPLQDELRNWLSELEDKIEETEENGNDD